MGGPGSGRKKGSGSKGSGSKKVQSATTKYANKVSKNPKTGYIKPKTIGKSTISVFDKSGKRIG